MVNRYSGGGGVVVPIGALSSRVGDEMAGTAILLFAFGGSSGGDGAVIFGVLAVAAAIGGPLLGVWIDRAGTAAPLALSLALFTSGLVGIGAAMHSDRPALAIVLALAAGLFGPAVAGGWSGRLTAPHPDRARRLVVFDASSYSIAGLVGPAIAGVMYAVGGSAAPLAATVGFLAVGTVCAPLAGPAPAGPGHDDGRYRRQVDRPHALADLRDGVRAIVRRPALARATASSCVAFFGFGAFVVLVPSIGEERFGTPAAGSLLLTCLAGAALVSSIAVGRRGLDQPDRVLAWSTALVGVGIATMLIDTRATALAAALVIGAGDGPQLASLIQIRHREAPRRLRTQVFTTGASLKIAASGVGALVAAPLAHQSLGAALSVAATAHLVAAAVAVRAGLADAGARRSVRGADRRAGSGRRWSRSR